jgi:hypothetical protein
LQPDQSLVLLLKFILNSGAGETVGAKGKGAVAVQGDFAAADD